MAAFMGTLNSYREICKEREIILREASVGVSLLAVVLSKAFVLLLIEDVQAAILTFGFVLHREHPAEPPAAGYRCGDFCLDSAHAGGVQRYRPVDLRHLQKR